MVTITLDEGEYYRRAYGAWLGKNVGGTLGEPVEGRKERLELAFYPELPAEFDTTDIDHYPDSADEGEPTPLANDDLDLQLVWLHALEQYGPGLTASELGREWVDHVFFPYNEYRYALANLRRGVEPPVSGWFNNGFYNDCMGAPIRSEIWALVAPGAPGAAARYAYEDAIVDHAGGEGVYGELFNAALESAAFVEDDPLELVEIGLTYVPEDCVVARAVRDTVGWYEEGLDWETTRERILESYGHPDMTNAPQNLGFVILGLLYGEGFGDSLLTCVNCGYDTDSTGAALGSILGILRGKDGIPEEWVEPIGHAVVTRPQVTGFPQPDDLGELTDRTLAMARRVIAARDLPVRIAAAEPTRVPPGAADSLSDPESGIDPRPLWDRSSRVRTCRLPRGSRAAASLTVTVDFGEGGPAIGKGEVKELDVTLANDSTGARSGELGLSVPDGWTGPDPRTYDLEPGDELAWSATVRADDALEPVTDLALEIRRDHDGSPWATEAVDLPLVAATHWRVEDPDGSGTEAVVPGNRIDVADVTGASEPGTYTLRTTLVNPRDRRLAIEIRTAAAVTAWLDGETIVDRGAAEEPDMLVGGEPYWGSEDSYAVGAGDYDLEIELTTTEGTPTAYVIPAGPMDPDEPGEAYFLTDVRFE